MTSGVGASRRFVRSYPRRVSSRKRVASASFFSELPKSPLWWVGGANAVRDLSDHHLNNRRNACDIRFDPLETIGGILFAFHIDRHDERVGEANTSTGPEDC